MLLRRCLHVFWELKYLFPVPASADASARFPGVRMSMFPGFQNKRYDFKHTLLECSRSVTLNNKEHRHLPLLDLANRSKLANLARFCVDLAPKHFRFSGNSVNSGIVSSAHAQSENVLYSSFTHMFDAACLWRLVVDFFDLA